ncbi:uncharacterized protein LOC129299643 [Prosopis cineraria]|uniref:uncharacterized protein LOC129299643 n=1 Tax=Prosopis cineraria TaxID=364024 RepID=UPI00240F13D1|nr:uncharacterized protein LOC129299643 [Prosopis cineraria]
MLLHHDACIMPPEVLACMKLIKEGHLEMIDWAGLIWCTLDKELKASQLENCYYASHLQHLIKTQHEELLKEVSKVNIEVINEEKEWELLREHNIELSRWQDDVEIFEVEKEQSSKEEEFEDEDDECILLGGMSPRISSVGMPSGSLIQAMGPGQTPFSSGNGLGGNSEDFFTYGEDAQMDSGPSLFGNGHKRYVGQDNHDNQSPTVRNKRLRSDSLWGAKPVDFDMCMEHIQRLMGEARMMYVTKAQACEEFYVEPATPA